MQESTTTTSTEMGLIYWGHMESREVLTSDGRAIGAVRGILFDPVKWTIPHLVVEVNKNILDELGIKKPMLSTALVNIPTKYVMNAADVVQLNADTATLRGAVSIYYVK